MAIYQANIIEFNKKVILKKYLKAYFNYKITLIVDLHFLQKLY